MARLTWQNVDAPDLGKAADILNIAALQIGAGGGTVASAARNARKDQMDRRSAAALPILAGIQSGEDVQGALSQIGGMLRPEDMNEETREAYLGLMGKGLGFDTTRVANDGVRASTASVRGAEGRNAKNQDREWAREDQDAANAAPLARLNENALYGPKGGVGPNGLPDNERDLLALTLQAEAGGEGYNGMLAAGSVVANRVKSGNYGVGFGGVITKPGQFSYLNGVTGYAGGEGAIDPSNVRISQDAYAAADAVLSGQYEDPTGGATHYYNDKVADPAWGANKAGGDWVRVGNHVFGSPDGKPATGETRVSDLIQENNLLPSSYWEGQVDRQWGKEEDGYQRGRSRDADADADYAAQAAKDARELAESVARSADRPEDVAALINQSDAPAEVRAGALAYAQQPEITGLFDLTAEQRELALPGGAGATTSLDVDQRMIDDVLTSNPTLRIQAGAEKYSNGDAAVILAEQLGMATEDGKGWALDAMTKIIAGAKENGVNLSPGEAAALALESTGYAGIGSVIPTGEEWGKTYVNVDDAVKLATDHLSTEQKAKGAEMYSLYSRAEEENETLRKKLGQEQLDWQRAVARGDDEDAAKFEKRFQEAAEAANRIAERRPYYTPPKATPAAAGTTANGTAATPAVDPLVAASLKVADQAIQKGTAGAIDLEELSKQAPDVQVQVLRVALGNLEANGAPEEELVVVEDLLEKATYEAQAPARAETSTAVRDGIGAGIRGALDPLVAAAMRVSEDALMAASGGKIDLARLGNAPPEQATKLLTSFIQQMRENGGSEQQIMALEGLLITTINGNLQGR